MSFNDITMPKLNDLIVAIRKIRNEYVALKEMKSNINYKPMKLNQKDWNQYVYKSINGMTIFICNIQ